MLRFSFIIIGCLSTPVLALWSCSTDKDCSSLAGSVCASGGCVCPLGYQTVLGGTVCAPVAPYHTSPCVEDFQCSRLFTAFQCRSNGTTDGSCQCQPGHHFFKGRCWPFRDYGAKCSRDEECLGALRDPLALACDGKCVCADGYYQRQRGECRKAGLGVGDGCVLDQDCLFLNGACNHTSFTCYDVTAVPQPEETEPEETHKTIPVESKMAATELKMAGRQHGAACGVNDPCANPLQCSTLGICFCPIGYYYNDNYDANDENSTICLAELRSPSTVEQCVGLLAAAVGGICSCPANFFYAENMRDCVKVARTITDACVMDENCHTFGAAARCGAPQPPWGVRACECVPELAVWDRARSMCRLFAGIGEACDVDSDCLAGELEIQCRADAEGNGVCACPDRLTEFEGLCITTGLELGDPCQISQECTGTDNTMCSAGRCACAAGYQEVDDYCGPVIGGSCQDDSDCVIQGTLCRNDSGVLTCQCGAEFVQHGDVCWPAAAGIEEPCNVTVQCTPALGDAGVCVDSQCACLAHHHHRDGRCWPITGLFEGCARSSQCYLGADTDRVVCRNSLCQCDFQFPYSEDLNTCTSASTSFAASVTLLGASLIVFNL